MELLEMILTIGIMVLFFVSFYAGRKVRKYKDED